MPVPAAWVNLFATPPSDRGLGGGADANGHLLLKLGTGQSHTLEDLTGGINLQSAKVEGTLAGSRWRIRNGDGKQYFIETATDLAGDPILIVRGENRTYDLAPTSFLLEVVGGARLYNPSTLSNGQVVQGSVLWAHMSGGFLLSINSTTTTFFFVADVGIDALSLTGRAIGLLVIQYGGGPGGTGIAGKFSLEIGAGAGPNDPGAIPGIFHFDGRAEVVLNTTLHTQVFNVPQEFLQVLPSTFPTTIYIKAIISGTITIQDLLVLTGSISVTLQVGTPSFIVIQGAVSTSIKFLGSLSGSIYLGVYSADPTNPTVTNPGIVGRVTLALNASVVPGVKFNGFFLLEVNLFVNPIASLQISTFQTCADQPAGATNCSDPNSYQLALDSSSHLIFGQVTIADGLLLKLHGDLAVAGDLVDFKGDFIFQFKTTPSFFLLIAGYASLRSRSTRTACRSTGACALGRRAEATAPARRQTPGSATASV
ncbi:MAG: hypothetical protein E6J28_00740 [Chloroflexi bacterium]|nr:MAG: hypothetical protein E6J28_00740 [Chloroflexota bacterium]